MSSEKLTITLTDRAPVAIKKDEWPVIASARDWDNEHEFQANRKWRLTVRQHEDGRTIVYGVHDTAFQNERALRAGLLLAAEDGIPAAINVVASNCDCQKIAPNCIADLPAEQL